MEPGTWRSDRWMSWMRWRMVQGNPGAVLAQTVGVGLGLGVGLGDGEARRVAGGGPAAGWLPGAGVLQPARVQAAARQQSAAVRRAGRCMPDRIRVA